MKDETKPEIKLEGEAAAKKILSLLGLSKKAGFAQGGEFLAEKAVKSGKSALLIVAEDAFITEIWLRQMTAIFLPRR